MRRRGFTLVELLVVIGIIVLLIAILLPMINKAQKDAKRTSISSDLMGIAQALDQYKEDFGDYPRMTPAPNFPNNVTGASTGTPSTGAVVLCWALMAPGPATVAGGGTILDGADGPGFRVRGTQGKVYGPYLNVDRYRVGTMPASGIAATIPPASPIDNSKSVIVDSDGNVILYFPGNKSVSPSVQALLDTKPIGTTPPTFVYNYNDNVPPLPASGTFSPGGPTLTAKIMAYKLGNISAGTSNPWKINTTNGETPLVAPFLLWSAGPDSVLGPGAITNGSSAVTSGDDDDVTYPETGAVPASVMP